MEAWVVFLPLLGAVIAGLSGSRLNGRRPGDRVAQWATVLPMLAAALLSVAIFRDVALNGQARTITLFQWLDVGTLEVDWAVRLDTLSAVMLAVVTIVSLTIHIYSIGYMSRDRSIPRFMAYLSLFTFFMLTLVTADNFLQMFFGWEGVGVASYLLIGFWFDRESANSAAIKAFIVNRVGDFGLILGIVAVYFTFDSLDFDTVFAAAEGVLGERFDLAGFQVDILTAICLLLFVGAMGKSAQLGLHTWLPDAMEGPTPVSALIHAATMVTAGVFMLARLSPLYEFAPAALTVIVFVGATTALFAATVGLTQHDIKRVIAYSTCSQLGYMVFAVGVTAYGAAVFHLVTHAFFKALLFLGAGSVIHGMHDEQDMRKMGGLFGKMKVTAVLMWTGSLALAGVPVFAGFYSKDIIIESAFARDTGMGTYAFWLGIAVALMTAFYSWRLLFLTFNGPARGDPAVHAGAHESPPVMLLPLVVLAAGAVFAGILAKDLFVGDRMMAFWGDSLMISPGHNIIEKAHHVPAWVKLLPVLAAMAGIVLAWFAYIVMPGLPAAACRRLQGLHRFLYNKWYFDPLYDRLFVRPAFRLGRGLWKGGDGDTIDRFGPNGVAAVTRALAGRASRLQTGYVYHYAFVMLVGVVIFSSWYVLAAIRGQG